MKRFFVALMCVFLIVSIAAPTACLAAKKNKDRVVYILNVENDGARVRKEPTSAEDNVEISLKKGTKVFYLGKKDAWYKIRSEFGNIGYTYKGFMSYYGAVKLKDIYAADGSVKMYTRPVAGARRSGVLSDNQHVIVYATSGKWAYIHTLSGQKGYVLKANLKTPG